MIVTAHIKFGLHSNFLDSMLQAEDERLPGESVEDGALRVYKKLEIAVEKLKKETNPHLYQEGEKKIGDFPRSEVTYGPLPIISKDFERLEIEIDNAQTLEELDAVLNRYITFPGKLLPQINAKRKQLKALDI